jgi:hypothetical protein
MTQLLRKRMATFLVDRSRCIQTSAQNLAKKNIAMVSEELREQKGQKIRFEKTKNIS